MDFKSKIKFTFFERILNNLFDLRTYKYMYIMYIFS
jgi:hypothetical protein